jgi:hypothetical protein
MQNFGLGPPGANKRRSDGSSLLAYWVFLAASIAYYIEHRPALFSPSSQVSQLGRARFCLCTPHLQALPQAQHL